MKLRAAAAFLLPFVMACSVHASDAGADSTPSTLDKTLELLHLKHRPGARAAARVNHQVEVTLAVSPLPIQLSENREVKVSVSLINHTKKYVDLNFPNSQRIEILIRDATGKVVTTWSEDQSFTNDPASVTVDPGERLQYDELLATREMNPGQPYTIEASFPSYPDLKSALKVIPEK